MLLHLLPRSTMLAQPSLFIPAGLRAVRNRLGRMIPGRFLKTLPHRYIRSRRPRIPRREPHPRCGSRPRQRSRRPCGRPADLFQVTCSRCLYLDWRRCCCLPAVLPCGRSLLPPAALPSGCRRSLRPRQPAFSRLLSHPSRPGKSFPPRLPPGQHSPHNHSQPDCPRQAAQPRTQPSQRLSAGCFRKAARTPWST